MKRQESAEDYLETILMLKQKLGEVRSIDIVNVLGYSKPSISVAMKNLREKNLIIMQADGHISLTSIGLTMAEGVYERHKVLTQALISLGVSETTAREDACRIEHDISNETFDKIKLYFDKVNSKE